MAAAGRDSLSLHVIFHQSVVWLGPFNILDESQETEKESCKVSKGLDPEVTGYCSWNILLVKASGRTSLDPWGGEIDFTCFWEVNGTRDQKWEESGNHCK